MRHVLPAVLVIVLCTGAPAASGAPAPRPTLATEDTMYTELPEVLVRAPRITLDEILDRVARGEARRDSLLADQSFQATFRLVRLGSKDKPDELMSETIARVYKKRPDKVRTVTVRQWRAKQDKKRADAVQVNFREDMSEEIVNFAFRPEGRREYRYRIVGRDLQGGRVIYRIAFEPRSPIDLLPSGLVWVETSDYVIVRQEIDFARSPAPLILKGVRRMVIERTHADGHWLLSRMLLRAETTIPLPQIGRRFDVSMRFDDYKINRGIPDAFFAAGPR
jgi:hypothetical protein